MFCANLEQTATFALYAINRLVFRRVKKKRKPAIRFVVSVCPPIRQSVRPSAWNNPAPTERIFTKYDIWGFFENLSGKLKYHLNLTRITGTLHEDQYTFSIISHSVVLRMRNVSDKGCRENQNKHFVFNKFFFLNPCRLWYNAEKYWTAGQATDDNMVHVHSMLDT